MTPFSNGSEYHDWIGDNCIRCTKVDACDIADALADACCGSGEINKDISLRANRLPGQRGLPCSEIILTDKATVEDAWIAAAKIDGSFLSSNEYWEFCRLRDRTRQDYLQYMMSCDCGNLITIALVQDDDNTVFAICSDYEHCPFTQIDEGDPWTIGIDIEIPEGLRMEENHE